MPEPQQIRKAYLQPITWTKNGQIKKEKEKEKFFVQFNPQSLKVAYSNQKSGNDQRGGSAIQFVGKGSTKLSVELLFDATVPLADGSTEDDVRNLTQRVAKFIQPDPKQNVSNKENEVKIIPPGIRFGWGTFSFEGVVDSINETLDYFSNEGKPLRATVALEISRQEIIVRPPQNSPGTKELQEINDGETVQQAAAKQDKQDDWQNTAAANGIENPRQVPPGTLLDMSAGVSAGFGAGVSAGFGGGISAGFGGGVSAGFGAGVSAGVAGGASASFGSSAGMSAGAAGKLSIGAASQLGFGASSRFDASAGFGAGVSSGFATEASAGFAAQSSASFGAGASAGFGAGASAGFGAGASGGFGAGASAGFGAGASAGIGVGASGGFETAF